MKNSIFFSLIIGIFILGNSPLNAQISDSSQHPIGIPDTDTEFKEQDSTNYVKSLVKEAAQIVSTQGEKAFEIFRKPESRWRKGNTYIFVIDKEGAMLVHANPEMENKNQLNLKDINGKPVVQGLLATVTSLPGKQEGWYHYQWPEPNGLLPRWKSSFVQLVKSPGGKEYIIGSGMYNDRMEREFVIDMVEEAAKQIGNEGKTAFKRFYDPTGPFLVKDSYIFVLDPEGVDLVNPAFQNLEGRNLMDLKDAEGKLLVQEMFKALEKDTVSWVDYMWPKPGDNRSTQKSTYVKKVQNGDSWLLVGAGVYLSDAPKAPKNLIEVTPFDLKNFVTDAAAKLEAEGEKAFSEFRIKDSHWFDGDKYVFVLNLEGKRIFHAADASLEGIIINGTKDALGRPYGRMFMETAGSKAGEGWVHYMFPVPGDIFPAWKSSYIKRVRFPSGKYYLVGSGIYNMKMDEFLIEEMVYQAVDLIKEKGRDAFPIFRNKKGPYYFMDTYIFILSSDGIELVNPAQPFLEGKNLLDLKDLKGNSFVKDEIEIAMEKGSGWLEMSWFKPGTNTPAPKMTFVKRANINGETFIVGSGYYPEKESK